jgi:hypothetical protein
VLTFVACGATTIDISTYSEAEEIVAEENVWDVPLPPVRSLETIVVNGLELAAAVPLI